MTSLEIIALLVSAVGVVGFATIITLLYRSYAASLVAELESGQKDVELIEDTIWQNIAKNRRWSKASAVIKQVLSCVALSLLIPFLILSVVSKLKNGVVMLFDKGMIAVVSGSMSQKHEENTYLAGLDDQIPTYDMIVVEKVDSTAELKKYDVIAFVNDEGNNIIHRIVDIEYTADGIRYVTRGDSNNLNDKYRPTIDDVIGKYTGKSVHMVGLFVMFLQSYSGILTMAALIYCLIMLDRVNDKISRAEEDRLAFLESSIDFKRETVPDDELESSFVETVRFKNFIYTFNEKKFISKTEVESEEPIKEEDATAAVSDSEVKARSGEEKPPDEKELSDGKDVSAKDNTDE
ncbi:MAG: signal peptidase I [Ruminococcaceae bacterium]|nr:signal peptidase I [Oscillospiraceae bacterium]